MKMISTQSAKVSLAGICFAAGGFILLMNLAGSGFSQGRQRHKMSPALGACRPPNFKAGEIAVYGERDRNLTVAERLKELKAHCHNGRLLGANKKEIRFFRRTCWGYPPPNYQELQAEEKRNLEALKAKYAVIEMGCDPRIP